MIDREALLDQLATCFAHAAVDRLLEDQRGEDPANHCEAFKSSSSTELLRDGNDIATLPPAAS